MPFRLVGVDQAATTTAWEKRHPVYRRPPSAHNNKSS